MSSEGQERRVQEEATTTGRRSAASFRTFSFGSSPLGRALSQQGRRQHSTPTTTPLGSSSRYRAPSFGRRRFSLPSPSSLPFVSPQQQPWTLREQAFWEALVELDEEEPVAGTATAPPQDEDCSWWLEKDDDDAQSQFQQDELESQYWLNQLAQASACPWDDDNNNDDDALGAWFSPQQRPLLALLTTEENDFAVNDSDDEEFGDFQSAPPPQYTATIVELPPLESSKPKQQRATTTTTARTSSEKKRAESCSTQTVDSSATAAETRTITEDKTSSSSSAVEVPDTTVEVPARTSTAAVSVETDAENHEGADVHTPEGEDSFSPLTSSCSAPSQAHAATTDSIDSPAPPPSSEDSDLEESDDDKSATKRAESLSTSPTCNNAVTDSKDAAETLPDNDDNNIILETVASTTAVENTDQTVTQNLAIAPPVSSSSSSQAPRPSKPCLESSTLSENRSEEHTGADKLLLSSQSSSSSSTTSANDVSLTGGASNEIDQNTGGDMAPETAAAAAAASSSKVASETEEGATDLAGAGADNVPSTGVASENGHSLGHDNVAAASREESETEVGPETPSSPAPDSTVSTGKTSENDDKQGDKSVEPAAPRNVTADKEKRSCSTGTESETDETDRQSLPISLRLPLKELDTLEARFVRRRQQELQEQLSRGPAVPTEEDMSSLKTATSDTIRTLEDLEQELPAYYFSQPHLDDTASFLEGLPWQYTSFTSSMVRSGNETTDAFKLVQSGIEFDDHQGDSELWDNYMTQHLCRLDGALESIQAHLNSALLEKAKRHELEGGSMLAQANSLIYDLDTNLRLAQVYYERSCQPLQLAADVLEEQNMLIDSWQQRSDLRTLSQTLVQVEAIFEQEEELWTRIDAFDGRRANAVEEYYALMSMTRKLQEQIATSSLSVSDNRSNGESAIPTYHLSKLQCLEEMRLRLCGVRTRFWRRLHDLAALVAVRACRRSQTSHAKSKNGDFCNGMDKTDWPEYESLVQSIVDLHSRGLDLVVPDGGDSSPSSVKSDCMDLSTTWAEAILESLCYETDRALAVALLHPTGEDNSSVFSAELQQLENDLAMEEGAGASGVGDTAKLRTLTHNLVTIRFNFEESRSNGSYLPRVFHRLCVLLADVLHQFTLLVKWHRSPFDASGRNLAPLQQEHKLPGGEADTLTDILSALESSRHELWDRCEQVLVMCLEKYVNFAAKRPLFGKDGSTVVDVLVWEDDLLGLSKVLDMADRFLTSKDSFLEDTDETRNLDKKNSAIHAASPVYEKLSDVFRRHLRSVHVEAMNSMGRLLAQESWIPTGLNFSTEPERKGFPEPTVKNMLLAALNSAICHRRSESETVSVVANGDKRTESLQSFKMFELPMADAPEGERTKFEASESDVYRVLNELVHESGGCQARIAPDCIVSGLIVWVSRLLHVMAKLPLIAEDVSAVFANICDLYITTVFRLCVGNAKSEQALLGIVEPSPLLLVQDAVMSPQAPTVRKPHGSPLFGFNRKGSLTEAKSPPRRTSLPLPAFLEAEICAPLPKDDESMEILRGFVERAQHSLRDIVNLDRVDCWLPDYRGTDETVEELAATASRTLEKRAAALLSCNIVAALLDVACSVAENIPATSLSSQANFLDDLVPLKAYVRALLEVTPALVCVACRLCCVRAVRGLDIVKEIIHVGSGWEESKLNEYPNDYIDDVCEGVSLLWGFLATSAKLPSGVLNPLWEGLVNGVYLSLLEGFARIPFCSTEGRALMTLDLASFASGVSPSSVQERLERHSLVCTPPTIESDLGMKYVDTYIKVFYYPKLDTLRWIEDNYMNYRLNHSLALISASGGVPEQHPDSSLSSLVNQVERLYRLDTEAEGED